MPERRRHRISSKTRAGGIGAKLGVYDDVFLCLSRGEPWREHGFVEHRGLEPAGARRHAGNEAGSRHWPVSTQRLHPVLGVSPWPRGSSDPDVGRLRNGPWSQPLRLDASGVNLRITEHPTREGKVDCAVVLVVEDLAVPEDHRGYVLLRLGV